jgi:DNA (cytosine-5)-methyltransferase 1
MAGSAKSITPSAPRRRSTKGFTFIDLFAGIGGMRQGFESCGGECVFSSEWDRFAQITYEKNFGETPHGDITQIPVEDIPAHDVLIAGFPCQPFSHAGLKRGFEDTRGTLFFNVASIAQHRRPAAILLENVKGFVNHDKGFTFTRVRETLEEIGYDVYWQVLNASDFGLPQNRERVFIVGLRKDRIPHNAFEFPEPPRTPTRVGDILEEDVLPKYTISTRLWDGHKRRLREHRAKGNGFGYGLFTAEDIRTNTISARYYKDGSEVLISRGRGKNPRKITPREAARLQGFPDSFVIPVSDVQAYRQFGNSVAVPVIKAVANQIVPHIRENRR